eukprot:CCRYP_006873-RF/>CCRYP_006873-RF protein AED:0.48 eAED:0.48 QI:0/0/0.5/1/0/0/2/275/60
MYSEMFCEWPNVRYERTSKENVSGKKLFLLPQSDNVFSPSSIFAAQSIKQHSALCLPKDT